MSEFRHGRTVYCSVPDCDQTKHLRMRHYCATHDAVTRAAPELLEVLMMLHAVLEHEPATYGGDLYMTSASRTLVLEVLAKAEGREP